MLALTLQDWAKVFDVNPWGTINSIHIFLPDLIKRREEHSVNASSGAGVIGLPKPPPYICSKFALVELSEAIFGQLNIFNIHVSVVIPSYIKIRYLSQK
ncbi:MAG: SDR family NAD(P)-dependent oxidoreductase [Candidatus Lokiarchaeota archaeon]|nr:SDR family NAD(P)-dependent oxidoreductase [Candidatus Lokiarchaeota archaeon]